MKEKLLNIKTIFKIIISVLIIFSMIKSCSKAVTWEDFIEFGHEIVDYDYVGYSDLSQGLPLLFTYQDNIETYLGDLDGYNGFCYISAWNSSNRSHYYLVYGINYTSTTTISCSSTSVSISNCSWKKLDSYSSFTQPTVSNSTGNFNLSGTINRLYFLLDNTWVTNWYNWIGNNRYNGVVQRLNTINSDNTILFDSLLGKYWFSDSYSWQLYSGDSFVTNLFDYDNNITENYDNLGFQLIAENQNLINTNYNYNVRLFVNDTLKYKSNNYTIYNNYSDIGSNSSNIGNITNASGDITGNINLGEINNNIAILPQNIGNTFYNSGDSGDKGIIQKVYDDLFTISEDKLNSKLSDFINDNNLDSGEAEIAMLGFNYLNNSGDFIISWNNINTPYFKLSGDSINFSAMVRNNSGLNNVMKYVHHILGLSLLLLLANNYFKTLLSTLGIGTEIYENNLQESQPVESVSVTTDSKGNKKTIRTLKTGNITQRWVH